MVNGKKSQLTTKSDKTLLKNCCSCGQKSKFSSMYHNSKELGLRLVHSPTKIEEIDFNLKTAEIDIFEHGKKFKMLVDVIKTLMDQNKFQQKLIDENSVRIQQLEEKLN